MSDKFYDFENFETDPEPEANKEQAFGQKYEKTVESANTVQSAKTEQPAEENSYEWNSDNPYRSGEYRYSYIKTATTKTRRTIPTTMTTPIPR